ncbi:MAG: hypothetical protein PW788_02710 [Micavibrio sp.]|nr:hypothetical protein [Micavibrio sp.]
MDFGFTPPDPDKALQALDNIKAAFAKAAAADTGAAQPLFQSLSDKFNKLLDDIIDIASNDPNPNPQKIMFKMMPVIMSVQMTAQKLQQAAQNDPRVGETLQELAGTVRSEIQALIPGGGSIGFPGGFNLPGADNSNQPAAPQQPKKPSLPPAPRFPKPKKPGGGDFNF